MPRQQKSLEKKRRGRPAIGKGTQINAVFRPEVVEAIDAFRTDQPKPRPSRPEAVRRLVERGLTVKGKAKKALRPDQINAENDG